MANRSQRKKRRLWVAALSRDVSLRLLVAMVLGVGLGRFGGVVLRMYEVAVGGVGVMRRFFMVAFAMVPGGFAMMPCRVVVVLGCLVMMIGCFF
jgi:hypothetical protein